MSATLHLARPDDLDRIATLIAAFHDESGIESSDEDRRAAITPLLEGSPHGVAYLIGPVRAPLGYIVLTFGWSVEFGGLDGFVDEIFIRPAVRGRGVASEVLLELPKALATAGLRALHLDVARSNLAAQKLYARAGFVAREDNVLMSKRLS